MASACPLLPSQRIVSGIGYITRSCPPLTTSVLPQHTSPKSTRRLHACSSTSTDLFVCQRGLARRSPTISFLKRLFGSTPVDPAAMEAAKTKAQGIIDENPVTVFSKSYCPYCRATKSLLTESGATFKVLELDQIDDGAALQDALEQMTHQRSVPNIFIGQKHIGGNSELQAQKSKLPDLLKAAHAL